MSNDGEPAPGHHTSPPPAVVIDPIDEASEVAAPTGGLAHVFSMKQKREDARRTLSYWLIAILGFLVLIGGAGWLWHGADTDRMQNFALLFSPIVTLLGTVLGFYFSSSDD